MKSISIVRGAILLALTLSAFAGAMAVTPSNLIAPSQEQTEPVHYRCHGYYGWYGYPYAPYRRCGRPPYRYEL